MDRILWERKEIRTFMIELNILLFWILPEETQEMPEAMVEHREAMVEHRVITVERRVITVERREITVEHREATVEHQEATVECREATVEHREITVEHRGISAECPEVSVERRVCFPMPRLVSLEHGPPFGGTPILPTVSVVSSDRIREVSIPRMDQSLLVHRAFPQP